MDSISNFRTHEFNDNQIALALGMEPQVVQNFANLIFPHDFTRKNIKATLRSLHNDLDNVGLEARFIISSGRVKLMLVRIGIWEAGATKACHRALKLNGKKEALKAKVVYTQVNPRLKVFDKEYSADLEKSVRFSKLLRKKTAVPRYFMKYKIETLKRVDGKKEKRLMANFSDKGCLIENLHILTHKERLKYISQLLIAGAAMESEGVLHRDLNPKNIFFEGKHIVIGDFGLTVLRKERLRNAVGTPGYIPPDIKEQDRYAMGIMLLEIATGGNFDPHTLLPDDHFGRIGAASQEKVEKLIADLREHNPEPNYLVDLIIALIMPDRITLNQAADRIVNLVEDHMEIRVIDKLPAFCE